jgi:hypothetical protein
MEGGWKNSTEAKLMPTENFTESPTKIVLEPRTTYRKPGPPVGHQYYGNQHEEVRQTFVGTQRVARTPSAELPAFTVAREANPVITPASALDSLAAAGDETKNG